MALIQVSEMSFESDVCGVKRRHFYNQIENKSNIVTDMELIFVQFITYDTMKLL